MQKIILFRIIKKKFFKSYNSLLFKVCNFSLINFHVIQLSYYSTFIIYEERTKYLNILFFAKDE